MNPELKVEVTVASQTPNIITHNLKDFAGVVKFAVQAIPPRTLLEMTKWML